MIPPGPICGHCTRNARTVDTPSVHVRVESRVLIRDLARLSRSGEPYLLIVRCHGEIEQIPVPGPLTLTDEDIAAMVVFRGE